MSQEIRSGTIAELKHDENNANQGTEFGNHLLRQSIEKLGVGRGVLAAKDGTIIGGNHVTEMLGELGIEQVIFVPTDGKTLVVTQRTDIEPGSKEFHELALADNKVGEVNLNFNLDKVGELSEAFGIDMKSWGFELEEKEKLRESYSANVGEVLYEPREASHRPDELFTAETRFDAEIEAIQNEGIRKMLKARAAFFATFNYAKIADYYAYQATAEEKPLFEKLALVLLDKDQLIANGFAEIMEEVQELNGFTVGEEDSDDE